MVRLRNTAHDTSVADMWQAAQKPTDYVTLVSSDGFEFVVLRSCATVAGAINRMLDPSSASLRISLARTLLTVAIDNFAESRTNRCVFENIKYDPLPSHYKALSTNIYSQQRRRSGKGLRVLLLQ